MLTVAGRRPRRSTKDAEGEINRRILNPTRTDLDSPAAGWSVRSIFFDRTRSTPEHVDHDFSHQRPNVAMSEVNAVMAIGCVGRGGLLIGARIENRPLQLADIKLAGDEIPGQGVEQLVVRCGVGEREVIDGMNDAYAKVMTPNAIGKAAGEERIVLRGTASRTVRHAGLFRA